jgi:hypothetical protein
VWTEPGSASGLRARITRTADITADDQIITAAASVDEICAVVSAWLNAFDRA